MGSAGLTDGIPMPTIEWNRMWRDNLQVYSQDPADGHYGNQWGDPDKVEILSHVKDRFITPYVAKSKTALEIGSGGGRWTQYMLGFDRVFCVDINREMFHYLLERFGGRPELAFCETDGTTFPHIGRRSVDYVFSFGTFVHLDPPIIEGYLNNLRPLLTPGATIVLQYADKEKEMAAQNEGFAMTTRAIMTDMVKTAGYVVVEEDNSSLPHSNVIRFQFLR